jgi:hypothetical protein
MSDPLATYLHDHLSGAAVAINLLAALRDEHAGEPLGQFAEGLLAEVEADRAVLQGLAERVGEALETLALGILGKLALWRALAVVAATDARLRGLDFDSLAARAQAQHARVEERRIEAALTAFKAAPG